jgi:hypothetical protein
MRHRFQCHLNSSAARDRNGVLLLVVLSMLTLFMLLGVTYLVFASRIRTTSRAFLKLADDQATTSVTFTAFLKDAALQVMRGTANTRSAIQSHDLLGDKYGSSESCTVSDRELVAGGQLLRLRLDYSNAVPLTGRVIMFTTGPTGVQGTAGRIVAAESIAGQTDVWVLRPRRATSANFSQITDVLVNGRDFGGPGFSAVEAVGTGKTSLNNSALAPNQAVARDGSLESKEANEDYDAVDEQNWALAAPDGSVRSFERKNVIDYWIREYGRQNSLPTRAQAVAALLPLARQRPSGTNALNPNVLGIRRATFRPFAFDHYQDTDSGSDFTGRSLASFDVIADNPGDVDTDGDGVLDSVWLDLGSPVTLMPDRKYVKPLFAIRCIDLGGRINVNAHGSPMHASVANVTDTPAFAPLRRSDGTKTPPGRLTVGLGFGPADVRLDAVLDPANAAAVVLGSDSATGSGDGIRRDIGGVVGRYGDGIRDVSSPPRPGQPDVNERRDGPATTWTDRGLPTDYWQKNGSASSYLTSPPDFWSRLAVGIDHRGHPFYANVAPSANVSETTDNPYELDLYRPRAGNGYAQPASAAANVDQPFTAAELEAVVRPFDIDNAAALPPRALALSLAGNANALATNRGVVTTDGWDTPAVIPTDFDEGISAALHDPDLVEGLKMDLNRPLGDGEDNDGDGIADEPGETGDPYGASYAQGWLLTRGGTVPISQPGPNEPHLRARQLFAYHIFNLINGLRTKFANATNLDPGFRLFAVKRDQDNDNAGTGPGNRAPEAVDPELNDVANPTEGDFLGRQNDHNEKVLAQWAVNVVDFLDADAIMTPFRYRDGLGAQYVVWGCEHPDVMITETLATHDRRTADTPCDPSGETTTKFRNEYKAVYDAWTQWNSSGRIGSEPPYPSVTDSDGDPNDADDMDFDQVRIPEGSLFLELYGLRSPNAPNLPRELYSYDAATGEWRLDLGRVPSGSVAPVWRLALSTNHTLVTGTRPPDVFDRLARHPDTEWLAPATQPNKIADAIDVERYVWFSANGAALPATVDDASGAGPTKNNTFYRRDAPASPLVRPGGYLVVGPRPKTSMGSLDGGEGQQKWGVPSKQAIILNASSPAAGSPAVKVTDLDGEPTPAVARPGAATFGNPLPPPDNRTETSATWLAMAPPDSWPASGPGIGLNVSEPLRNAYYPRPTEINPATGLQDAYGKLDDESHQSFIGTPLDRAPGTPIGQKLLSGGSFANFCTVFVERLADPTKPYERDPADPDWNPYIVVDFMPVDLTVFNGESTAKDPSETQGPDRDIAEGELPVPASVTTPPPPRPQPQILPQSVPLPVADKTTLAARHVYFHTRQRGFGKDLPNYDNDGTLFGIGTIQRNPHPFKPIGLMDDIVATPERAAPSDRMILPGGRPTVPRNGNACFRHELGQTPAGRTTASDWRQIPYHSLGWVNSSFGYRLDVADGVPAAYAGAPDRPFPWLVWNDRPFANPFELIFVPRTPASRLLTNFRNLDYPDGLEDDDSTPAYSNVTAGVPYNAGDLFGAPTPGSHLLPITSITDVPGPSSTRSRHADVLVRLFEYVRVRSPFFGSETVLSGTAEPDRPHRFVGPFNRISTYREPGRVNINTIHPGPEAGAAIWNAICGGTASPPFIAIGASGTGARIVPLSYGSGTASFIRPYRSASGERNDFADTNQPRGWSNALVPAGWLTNPVTGTSSPWYVGDGTSLPEIGDRFSTRSFTLLGDQPRPNGMGGSGRRQPLFPAPALDAWANDGRRNAWFRFETLIRANANTTVRSEVYAIWVTMGLFEVVGNQSPSWIYPDGYRLVREYGSESGDATRHRAFFIFDRSIPIGYEAGVNHNVEDGILVDRLIE